MVQRLTFQSLGRSLSRSKGLGLISMSVVSLLLLTCQNLLAQEWRPVRGGNLYGISGIATIQQSQDAVELLVVHDSKKPDQTRLAIVTIAGNVQPRYLPLVWQKEVELPIDLEGLTVVPGTRSTYMAVTSGGKVFHFSLNVAENRISILKIFDLPGLPTGSNLEGFALTQLEGELVAVWAHRGEAADPAIVYWGTMNLATYQLSLAGSSPLKVPLAFANVRPVSDLKLDSAGVVYITAASDNGDEGPFQSAVYVAGAIGRHNQQLVFRQNTNLVPLYRDNYHKVEAIDLLPGSTGGIVLGTDDEAMGSSVMLTPSLD